MIKNFLYIVSNEDEEEGDNSQTTIAVILVIAWCLVAVIAFFYYKQTKTGIKNDILFLDYSHEMHCPTWYARVATLHYIVYFIGSAKESKEEGNQKVTTPNGTDEDKNEGVQPAAVEPDSSLASGTTSTGKTTTDKIYPNLSDQIDQSN